MSQQTYSAGTNNAFVSRGKWHKQTTPVLGQVAHVDGSLWNVRDVRPTKHGFDLYYGYPSDTHGSWLGGVPRLIDTQALHDFWSANRLKGHGFLFDLPAGRTTLKRARKRMGFNFDDDTMDFWLDRFEDLKSLRPQDFAARHGVSVDQAFEWRTKIVGIRARPLGWWRTPDTFAILLSDIPLRVMGEKLGIKITHSARLRRRARLEPLTALELAEN